MKLSTIMLTLFILFIFSSHPSWSADKSPLFLYQGFKISSTDSCKSGAEKCQARKLVDERPHSLKEKSPYPPGGANPAAHLCLNFQGAPLTRKSTKGHDISICQFSDGSFIVSWDLLKLLP